MNNKATRYIGIIILVVILAVVGYFYNRNYAATHPAKTVAQQGQVISGFPKELLLGVDGAKIVQSYSLQYGNKATQYTANYTSTDKLMALVYVEYRDYLKTNGYYLNNANDNETDGIAVVYGTKGNTNVNVLISRNGDIKSKNLNVTISYLQKGN